MSFDAFASVAAGPATSPAPEAPPTPSSAPDSGGSSTPSGTSPSPTPKTTPEREDSPSPQTPDPNASEWAPNFKFKVMDAEHEMDEYFRQFVKTPDDEKKFREIYEKAYGLDVVKPKFQATRQQLQETRGQLEGVKTQIGDLASAYQRGDFEGFFKTLGVPEEKILQWVIDKAQYKQLPPEQRQALDAKRNAEDRVFQLERQFQTVQKQYEAQATQVKAQGLQVALERPDVKQFVSSYDSKRGAGSFYNEVIQHGEYVWFQSKGRVDLTPDQAVQAVLERYQAFAPVQNPNQPPVIPADGNPQGSPRSKPLPNLAGRNSTSVGKIKPRSLEDLKKLAAEMDKH